MTQLETIDLDLDDIYEILTNHINRIDNPHRVKPADLNLEKVYKYLYISY